jgi:hypothetical protein
MWFLMQAVGFRHQKNTHVNRVSTLELISGGPYNPGYMVGINPIIGVFPLVITVDYSLSCSLKFPEWLINYGG